jgi:hypothetical protein
MTPQPDHHGDPVKHFADGMQADFLGTSFRWTDVLIVAAWGLRACCSRHGTSTGAAHVILAR